MVLLLAFDSIKQTTNEKEEHVYSFKAFSLVPKDSPLRKLISFPQSNLYSSDSVGLRVYLSHNGKVSKLFTGSCLSPSLTVHLMLDVL